MSLILMQTSGHLRKIKLSEYCPAADSTRLKWSEEDKAFHPEAAKLGADLLSAQDVYKDLQNVYKRC